MKMFLDQHVNLEEFKQMLRDKTTDALSEIEQLGYHNTHVSSTFLDFLMSDCEQLCAAVERYLGRKDSGTYTDLYTCVNVMCDRLELETAKLYQMRDLGTNLSTLRYLQTVLDKLRSLFMQENKGVDLASRLTSRVGVPHRRNSLLKLGKQRIFEKGIIEERD